MRCLIVLLLLTATAHADQRFTAYGLGTSVVANQPGWALRMEQRIDSGHPDRTDPLFGLRFGLDAWEAGGRWGFAVPAGIYTGAQLKAVRTTLGGGVGLFTLVKGSGSEHFGVSPFASASFEASVGKLLVSLDGRLARQVVVETGDFNVYTVMLMVGKRFRR